MEELGLWKKESCLCGQGIEGFGFLTTRGGSEYAR
jgi:hypothetical protein